MAVVIDAEIEAGGFGPGDSDDLVFERGSNDAE